MNIGMCFWDDSDVYLVGNKAGKIGLSIWNSTNNDRSNSNLETNNGLVATMKLHFFFPIGDWKLIGNDNEVKQIMNQNNRRVWCLIKIIIQICMWLENILLQTFDCVMFSYAFETLKCLSME